MGNDVLDNSQNMLAEGYISRTEAMEAAEKKQKVCDWSFGHMATQYTIEFQKLYCFYLGRSYDV